MTRHWQKALNRSPKEKKTRVSWHSVKKTNRINHKVSPNCPLIAQHTSVFIAVMSQVRHNSLLRKLHHCDDYCRSKGVEEANLSAECWCWTFKIGRISSKLDHSTGKHWASASDSKTPIRDDEDDKSVTMQRYWLKLDFGREEVFLRLRAFLETLIEDKLNWR